VLLVPVSFPLVLLFLFLLLLLLSRRVSMVSLPSL
jgi:hypothetical protein